jgi:thiamine biosynthesis lipoprotein
VHARTDGGFDASVGPLVHRYGFGPIAGGPAPFGALETGTGRLRKDESALTLDLCGIAKGAALDAMIARLAPHVRDLMMELGGEIRTLGRHPDGRPWRIGVEHPLPGTPRVHRVIAPLGLAVATSGHGAKSFGTATHLIDPRRARPADTRLASVTVLARRAQDADALATALAALGPEDGPALAQARSIRALFLFNDAGRISDHVTAGFADHILA